MEPSDQIVAQLDNSAQISKLNGNSAVQTGKSGSFEYSELYDSLVLDSCVRGSLRFTPADSWKQRDQPDATLPNPSQTENTAPLTHKPTLPTRSLKPQVIRRVLYDSLISSKLGMR